jgi:outer membrane protein assembly factor BamB
MKQIFIIVAFITLPMVLYSQSKQFRGYNRTGHFPAENLLKTWPEDGPELLFKTEGIGKGYSSAVLSKNTIFVSGKIDTMDCLTAINLSGEVLWQVPYGRAWTRSYSGTRSTPTIDGKNIYLTSGNGELACVNRKNGKIKWNVDVMKEFEGVFGSWGHAESPLEVDDKVIFTAAGPKTTMVAFNKKNGDLVWATESLEDKNAFVSPILINYNDQKMIVGVAANNILAVNPEDGQIIWTFEYAGIGPSSTERSRRQNNTVTPLHHDDHIYVTSGYNHVGLKLKLDEDGSDVQQVWTDTVLDVHHGGVVLVEDCLYGSNWINNREGNWCSIDWETGEANYEQEWNTKGSVIFADGLLYIYEEHRGNVGLVRPDPNGFDLISSFRVEDGAGPHWAHPSIYEGKLFLRHGDVLMVYNIKDAL